MRSEIKDNIEKWLKEKKTKLKMQKMNIALDPSVSYTDEEIFMGLALAILINKEEDPLIRERVWNYLRNLPPDFFKKPQLKELHQIIISIIDKNKNFLNNSDALLHEISLQIKPPPKSPVLTCAELIKLLIFLPLVNLPLVRMPEPFTFFLKYGEDLILKWKKEKLTYLSQKLAQSSFDEEIFEDILQKFKKIKETQFTYNEQKIQELFSLAIKPEDFHKRISYLYSGFIPENAVIILASMPGQGKSIFSTAFSCYLLDKNVVEYVLYYDGDNSFSVLQERRIGDLIEKYKNRFLYHLVDSSKDFQNRVKLAKNLKAKTFIVIDTLRAFAGGVDLNKGEVAEKIMGIFKNIISSGEKTILILHHLNKPPQNLVYEPIQRIKGATEFVDRADLVFLLTKKKQSDFTLYLNLKTLKGRVVVRDEFIFKINVKDMAIEELDEEIINEKEEEFIFNTIEIIKSFQQEKGRLPNKTQIEKALKMRGFKRNQIRKLLEKFTGKFWEEKYLLKNNEKVFAPLYTENDIIKKWQTGELGNNAELREDTKSNNGEPKNNVTLQFESNSLENLPDDLKSFLYDKECPLTLDQLEVIKNWGNKKD